MLHRLIYGVVRRQFKFRLSQTPTFRTNSLIYSETRKTDALSNNTELVRTRILISLITGNRMPRSRSKELDEVGSGRDEDDNDIDDKNAGSEESIDLQSGQKFDETILEDLREAYDRARKGQKSVWLDYKKACYVYLYRGGGEPNDKLTAFDLDGTIVKPKSNKRVPRSATDWEFFSVWTKVKLQQTLRENLSRFVMFTNQNGVGLGIVPLEEVQERIELTTKRLDIPCCVFVAIDKDRFRKPNVGMFELFLESFNDSKPVDYEESFYCGDAVGYPSFSDADIKFAQRLGLPFLPPEKFLRGVKPKLVEEQKK